MLLLLISISDELSRSLYKTESPFRQPPRPLPIPIFTHLLSVETTDSKWLSTVRLAVTINVQPVWATTYFSRVSSTAHVALGITIRSDGSTVGEAITTI